MTPPGNGRRPTARGRLTVITLLEIEGREPSTTIQITPVEVTLDQPPTFPTRPKRRTLRPVDDPSDQDPAA